MTKTKNKKIDLSHFPAERRRSLEAIKRYDIFNVMLYRTNDWIHTNRVAWLTEELLPVAKKFFKNIDSQKTILLALIHDDPEIITGDYNASHKTNGSKKFLLKIEKEEIAAIEKLSREYPKNIGKYNYKDLLYQTMEWDGIEGKIACYADKLDALCESLHEVLAGNMSFLPSVIFCADRLSRFEQKYPELKPFLNYKDSPLTNLKMIFPASFRFEAQMYKKYFNKPFTKQSIKKSTIFSAYNAWRDVTIKHWKKDGLQALIKQKEFLR